MFWFPSSANIVRFEAVTFALFVVEDVMIWADLWNATAVADFWIWLVVEVLVWTTDLGSAEAISEVAIIVKAVSANNSLEDTSFVCHTKEVFSSKTSIVQG